MTTRQESSRGQRRTVLSAKVDVEILHALQTQARREGIFVSHLVADILAKHVKGTQR